MSKQRSASASNASSAASANSGLQGATVTANGSSACKSVPAKQIQKLGGPKKVVHSMLNYIKLLSNDNGEKKQKDLMSSVEKYTSAINNIINILNQADEKTKIEIVNQVEQQKAFSTILPNFSSLPFESKKHMLYLWQTTLHYFSKNSEQMVKFAAYLDRENVVDLIFGELVQSNCDGVVNNLSEMIKECSKYQETFKLVIKSRFLIRMTENFTSPNTNISSQAFFTFRDILKSQYKCMEEWTRNNYDEIQSRMTPLLMHPINNSNAFMYQIFVTTVYRDILASNDVFKEKFLSKIENLIMMLTVLENSKGKTLKVECLTVIKFFISNPDAHYIIISNIANLDKIATEFMQDADSKNFTNQLQNLFSTFLMNHLHDPNLVNYLKKYSKAVKESKIYRDLFLHDNSNLDLLFDIVSDDGRNNEDISRECVNLIVPFLPVPSATLTLQSRNELLKDLIMKYMDHDQAELVRKQILKLGVKK